MQRVTVGENIKHVRRERKMTQQDLAEAAKCSHMSIRRFESGEREPRLSTLHDIAAALNVSVDYLMGLTTTKSPELLDAEIDTAFGLAPNVETALEDREIKKDLHHRIDIAGRKKLKLYKTSMDVIDSASNRGIDE